MKRILSMLLSMAMVMSLAACGKPAEQEPAVPETPAVETPAPEAPVEIQE